MEVVVVVEVELVVVVVEVVVVNPSTSLIRIFWSVRPSGKEKETEKGRKGEGKGEE